MGTATDLTLDLLSELGGASEQYESENLPTTLQSPSSHYSTGVTSAVEEKALQLLGAGISQEATAAALGVSPSRITQLLSEKTFSDKVANLRYAALQKHSERDGKYDSLEDQLLLKLEKSLPLLLRPESILKAITVVNGAKRRGQAAVGANGSADAKVVQIVVPTFVAQRFSVNLDNQVIRAGSQELLTMQASKLLQRVEQKKLEAAAVPGEIHHDTIQQDPL